MTRHHCYRGIVLDSLDKNVSCGIFAHEGIRLAQTNKANGLIIGIILLAGYILRLFYAVYYPVLSRDSYTYYNIIERSEAITDINRQEAIYPLFFWLYRLPTHLNVNTISACRALNIFFGTLTILLMVLALQLVSSKRIVWVSGGLIAAAFPELVHYSSQLQRESMFLFFSSLILFSLAKYVIKNTNTLFFLGLFTGCNLLVRHESLDYIPLILFVIILVNRKKSMFSVFKCIGLYLAFTVLSTILLLCIVDPIHISVSFLITRIYKALLVM